MHRSCLFALALGTSLIAPNPAQPVHAAAAASYDSHKTLAIESSQPATAIRLARNGGGGGGGGHGGGFGGGGHGGHVGGGRGTVGQGDACPTTTCWWSRDGCPTTACCRSEGRRQVRRA